MSEAMTVEMIIEAEWILKGGYWSRLRHPFQMENGAWSDIDVLSYSPSTKHLVISESKVRGPKNHIRAYTEHSKSCYGNILEFDGNNYFSFLYHLPVFLGGFSEAIDLVTIQLVSNQVIAASLVKEVNQTVSEELDSVLREVKVKHDLMLDTTLDVLARVIELERERKQGRRFGHPVIDIARELNRYLHPRVSYAGKGRSKTETVKKEGLQGFWRAIDGNGIAALLAPDKVPSH